MTAQKEATKSRLFGKNYKQFVYELFGFHCFFARPFAVICFVFTVNFYGLIGTDTDIVGLFLLQLADSFGGSFVTLKGIGLCGLHIFLCAVLELIARNI